MKLFNKYRWILLLIVFSSVLRLLIYFQVMNTTPFADYFAYKQWVYKSYSYGFHNLYLTDPDPKQKDLDEPPGTIYILRGSYEIFLQTAKTLTHFMHLKPGSTLWINDNLLIFFLRLPSILADLILGFFVYFFVKTKTNEKIGLISSAFYLLSPPIIYNSTVWGQIDSINNLFFYLALIFLIKRRAFLSVLFYAFSLFVKFSLLPLAPLYLLLAFFGGFFKRSSFVISVVVVGLIILFLTLPFSSDPFWFINFAINNTSGMNNSITVNAFNFWWLILNPIIGMSSADANVIFLGLKLSTWGNMLFAIFYIPVILYSFKLIKKSKLSADKVFLLFIIVAFTTFLFLPRMHERYLYPVLPLLITWTALGKKYWVTTAILNIIHFINLYVVWNPIFIFGFFENVIRNQTVDWLLSLMTISIFIPLYLKLFSIPKLTFKINHKQFMIQL